MSANTLADKALNHKSWMSSHKLDLIPDIEREKPFPVNALGVLAPAAQVIADVVQVPASVAGLSLLTTAALSAQAFYNVENDGRICPVSLYGLSILNSGDRKTAADDLASAPVKEWEAELLSRYNEEYPRYKNKLDVYETQRSAILKDKKCPNKEAALNELIKPQYLPEPNIITGDPTIEGLQKSFFSGQPSQGLFTAEGGVFFGGHGMSNDNKLRTIAGLSQFWGAEPIRRTRGAKGESFSLHGRRLSSHLMMQPVVADTVLTDNMMTSQVFIARFLMAKPTSLAGTRAYNFKNAKKSEAIQVYNRQMLTLLSRDIETDENGGLILKTLSLDASAKESWVGFYNEIEGHLGANGELDIISETASKIAENALRIAGVLCATSNSVQITIDHMSDAIELSAYFLNEQLRLAQTSELDTTARNANELDKWIQSQGERTTINELQKNGPRSTGVRKSVSCARKLMEVLVDHHRYIVTGYDKHGGCCSWEVLPDA